MKKSQNAKSEELNNIERIAVACAMADTKELQNLKKGLFPGTYEGKVALEVQFAVVKGTGSLVAPTCNLLSLPVLGLALKKMGPKGRDAFLEALRDAAMEALVYSKAPGKNADVGAHIVAEDSDVAAKMAEIEQKVIAGLPLVPKSGSTKVTAKVVRLQISAKEEQSAPAVAIAQ